MEDKYPLSDPAAINKQRERLAKYAKKFGPEALLQGIMYAWQKDVRQTESMKEIYRLLDKLTEHYPPPKGLSHTLRKVTEEEKAIAGVNGDILFIQMEVASHKSRVMVFIDTNIGGMDFETICVRIDKQLDDIEAQQQDVNAEYRGELNVGSTTDLAEWFDAANPVVRIK